MKSLLLASISLFIIQLTGCSNEMHEEASVETKTPRAVVLEPNADLVRTHMTFLASDDLLGRETGMPGYDKAADYVANEFKKLGLLPGGNNGSYFQVVTFRSSNRDASKVNLEVKNSSGAAMALDESTDYYVGGSLLNAESNITAEVVFAGYGLVAPEMDRDDYAGLDVKGKLVALLQRTPDGIQSEERAYYGSQKAVEASKRGAVGTVSLYTPVAQKIHTFERRITEKSMDKTKMGWIQDDGQVHTNAPNLKVSAVFSLEGAEKLFANAPVSWANILEAAAENGGVTPTFDLPLSMTIKQASTMGVMRSANVIGVIPGSDPSLKHEVLVLSAHLDHLGVSKTGEGDRINNGALDNAGGVATLIETARMLMAQESRPRRTVLFLANTAEEKGLLGSQYFAKNPTLDDHEIVANINLDMPVLTYDFQDVVVFGGDRSTLRSAIQSAANQMGLAMADDPFPEQGVFTRSDHFRFVQQGIPSVMLATGMANGGDKAWADHFARTYHRPADDMSNNIDFDAAAKFAELKTRITLEVANADQRPLWNKDDFFARQFNGPMKSN